MGQCKPINTPLSNTEKLITTEGDKLGPKDSTRYRRIVGALQYLTLTRQGISFSVNKACQFILVPTTVHWCDVKRLEDTAICAWVPKSGTHNWKISVHDGKCFFG